MATKPTKAKPAAKAKAGQLTEEVQVERTTDTPKLNDPIYEPMNEVQHETIKALAIELCRADAHRDPFKFLFGRPVYMNYFREARTQVVAREFFARIGGK